MILYVSQFQLMVFFLLLAAVCFIAIYLWQRADAKKLKIKREQEAEEIRIQLEDTQRRIIDKSEEVIVSITNAAEELRKEDKIIHEHYIQLLAMRSPKYFSNVQQFIQDCIAYKERLDFLTTLYPAEQANNIMKKVFWLGMTEEQLIHSIGNPDKIEVEQMKTKTKRTLIYGNKTSGDIFVFESGELVRFKDR